MLESGVTCFTVNTTHYSLKQDGSNEFQREYINLSTTLVETSLIYIGLINKTPRLVDNFDT